MIAENVKRFREEKGMTQAALAKAVKVSQAMSAQVERGTRTLTLPLAKAIVDVLGCGLDDLLTGRQKGTQGDAHTGGKALRNPADERKRRI